MAARRIAKATAARIGPSIGPVTRQTSMKCAGRNYYNRFGTSRQFAAPRQIDSNCGRTSRRHHTDETDLVDITPSGSRFEADLAIAPPRSSTTISAVQRTSAGLSTVVPRKAARQGPLVLPSFERTKSFRLQDFQDSSFSSLSRPLCRESPYNLSVLIRRF